MSYIKDVQNALKVLRGYKEECIQNLWIEENSYISEIIYGLEKPLEKNSSQKTERNSYKKQIRFEKEKLKVATEMLNKKYKEEAQKLDEKFTSPKTLNEYSKPSQTLLKLKVKARGLLKENKFDEANNEIKKVAKLEQKETKKMNDILKQTYFEEDKALKEKYIFLLNYFRKKTELKIRKLEREMFLINNQSEYKEKTNENTRK